MKKLLALTILLSGCTTYQDNDQYLPPIQTRRPIFQQSLAQSQIQASQLNQLVSGLFGPNKVSGGLLAFQNYNRNANAIVQNPWNGFFMLRNAWVK